ncbi:MAG TPA: hypothetical protein ENH85_00345 [Candidatus Scalindua sp.]|nr:hypothetical protein [Candidatus Scalindua sp.]
MKTKLLRKAAQNVFLAAEESAAQAISDMLSIAADEIDRLRKAFCHIHVNNGIDDSCKECNMDLRDEIHIRGETVKSSLAGEG